MTYKIVWKGSPNFNKQFGVKKKFIVFHWIVGGLDGATQHFSHASVKVATNYGVGEGRIHQYVKDKDYAYGSGDYKANRYGISIEHEGGWMQKNGTRKKPTKKTLETSAWLCAKIARDHKMGKLVPFKNAFPHKQFVATACPGTLDWEWICKEANRINAEIALAASVKPVEPVVVVPPVVVLPEPPKAPEKPVKPSKPTKPAAPKKVYYTIKNGDSYWRIAEKTLGTKNGVKIIREIARLKKLNNYTGLFAGNKLRIK
jgi:LysM repeat protein